VLKHHRELHLKRRAEEQAQQLMMVDFSTDHVINPRNQSQQQQEEEVQMQPNISNIYSLLNWNHPTSILYRFPTFL